MALPKLEHPLFDLKIPSTQEKVKFRPFTVKEEKILLVAKESQERSQMIDAIKQIISNCIEDIEVNKLAIFDIEYIMLQIRAKSVNNVIDFKIKDPDTEEEVELSIDIDDIQIQFDDDHTDRIHLQDETYLIMRYPSVKELDMIFELTQQESSEKMFDLLVKCFDKIVDGENVYNVKDHTDKEIEDFVNSLSSRNIQEIKKFFDTMPVMKYEKKYKNKNGDEKTFVVRGTETFFL